MNDQTSVIWKVLWSTAMIYTCSFKWRNFTLPVFIWNHNNTTSSTRYISSTGKGKQCWRDGKLSQSLTVYKKNQGWNFNADSQQSLESNWSWIHTKRKDALEKMALQSFKIFLQTKQDITFFKLFLRGHFQEWNLHISEQLW